MNNPYSLKNFALKIRRHLKSFFQSYLKMLKNLWLKIGKNHIKIIKIGFMVLFISVVSVISYKAIRNQYDYLHRFDGPRINKTILSENDFRIVEYLGEIDFGNIRGNGVLTIKSDKWNITFNGVFNNNSESDNKLTIGEFVSGTIEVVDLDSKNRYVWSGEFNSGNLKKGTIEKSAGNTKVIYTGMFKNNKLDGLGRKYISIDGSSRIYKGWFENGELIE